MSEESRQVNTSKERKNNTAVSIVLGGAGLIVAPFDAAGYKPATYAGVLFGLGGIGCTYRDYDFVDQDTTMGNKEKGGRKLADFVSGVDTTAVAGGV